MRVFALVARADGSLAARGGRDRDGLAVEIHADSVPLAGGQTLSPDHIKLTGVDNREAKTSAARGAWLAYSRLNELGLVHRGSDIPPKGITLDLAGDVLISGSSAGLAFLVAMAGRVIEEYLRLTGGPCPEISVAATGVVPSIGSNAPVATGGSTPIEHVKDLQTKLEAGAEAVGDSGYLMYPASSDVGDVARNLRHIPVATPNEAIDRILDLYKLQAKPPPPSSPLRAAHRRFPWPLAAAGLPIVALIVAVLLHVRPPCLGCPKPGAVEVAVFREGSSGEPEIVAPNATLRSDDYVRIRLRPERDCFVYVLSVDPNLRAQSLFPREKQMTVQPKGEFWIPSASQWFALNNVVGAERLIAIGATQRIAWLEDLIARFDEAAALGLTEQSAVVNRLEESLVRDRDVGKLAYTQFTFSHK